MSTTPATEASTPTLEPIAPDTQCPKCQKPLVDPHGLGWCQACGYCRSLGDDGVAAKPEAKSAPATDGAPALPPLTSLIPLWLVGLILGMVILAGASWALNRFVPLKPLHRATWTSVQVGLGVLVMLVGQCFALLRIAPEDGTLTALDAVVPFRLYGLVCKRLPQLCSVFFFAAWGATLVASALAFIGGLSHWLTYLPKSH